MTPELLTIKTSEPRRCTTLQLHPDLMYPMDSYGLLSICRVAKAQSTHDTSCTILHYLYSYESYFARPYLSSYPCLYFVVRSIISYNIYVHLHLWGLHEEMSTKEASAKAARSKEASRKASTSWEISGLKGFKKHSMLMYSLAIPKRRRTVGNWAGKPQNGKWNVYDSYDATFDIGF